MQAHQPPKVIHATAWILAGTAAVVLAVAFVLYARGVMSNQISASTQDAGLWVQLDQCGEKLTVKVTEVESNIPASLKSELSKFGDDAEKLKAKSQQTGVEAAQIQSLIKTCNDLTGKVGQIKATPSGEKPATVSAKDWEYFNSFNYAAKPIANMEQSADCQNRKFGQILLVTDYTLDNAANGTINAAISDNSIWTKRGKLYKIEDKAKDEVAKRINATNPSPKFEKASAISGAYFLDVPVGKKYTVYLYSEKWGTSGVVSKEIEGPANACDSKAFVVLSSATKSKFKVCVHSTDQGKEFIEKQTLTYPDDQAKIIQYKKDHAGNVISVGPCQDQAEIAKLAKEGKLPGQTASGGAAAAQPASKQPAIGADENPPGQVISTDQAYADAVLKEVNVLRAQVNVVGLKIDPTLQNYTQDRLATMVSLNQCEHLTSINPSQYALNPPGATSVGENIAINYETGTAVADGWKNAHSKEAQDRTHYENVVNKDFTKTGIAAAAINNQTCLLEIYSN